VNDFNKHIVIKPAKYLVLLLLSIGLIWIFIGTAVLYSEIMEPTDSSHILSGIGMTCVVLGFACVIAIYWVGNIEIHQNVLKTYSYFGHGLKRYSLNEFDSWYESIGVDDFEGMRNITLVKGRKKYQISNAVINQADYQIFKNTIAQLVLENQNLEVERVTRIKRIGEVVLVVLGLFALYGSVHLYVNRDVSVSENELKVITGEISFIEVDNIGDNEHIYIELVQYPRIRFNIGSVVIGKTYPNHIKKMMIVGDSLTLGISHLDTAYLQQTPIKKQFVDICTLQNDKYLFLSLEDYNRAVTSNNSIGNIGLAIMGFGWLYLAFNSVNKRSVGGLLVGG
jgi:hypothetical protein